MASWAGRCPGNRESAGIQKGRQTTPGNSYLRTALVQCAWAATREQGSVFQARFHQLSPRRGPKCAIVAIAHQMLIILHCMLTQGIPFRGAETVPQQRWRQRRAHHHLRACHAWRLGSDRSQCRPPHRNGLTVALVFGSNRHVVGDARTLQERRTATPFWPRVLEG